MIGLLVAVLLWRSGPLSSLGLLYSTPAMVIAKVVIDPAPRQRGDERRERVADAGRHRCRD
ncbi:MAG: hypothetical protein ACRDT0_00310 [Pseudonocardiaceae bacterium]